MRDYSKGKIYKIVCNITGLTYYGSTCEPALSRRLAKHRSNYKDYLNKKDYSYFMTSYNVLENGNCDIILMENYPCNSNDELTSRERYYIETFECVNRIIPTRTHKEFIDANKEKYQKYNIEYSKKYREENREKLLEEKRKKYSENKDLMQQRQKELRKKNNIRLNCICGSYVLKYDFKIHLKSKKHIDFINNNNNNI